MIYMMRFTLSLAACSHSRTSSLAGSFFLFILYLFTPHINATQQDDICWLAAAWLLVLVVIILAHLSFFYFISFFFFFNFFLFQPIKRESFDDCMRLKSFFTLLDVDKRRRRWGWRRRAEATATANTLCRRWSSHDKLESWAHMRKTSLLTFLFMTTTKRFWRQHRGRVSCQDEMASSVAQTGRPAESEKQDVENHRVNVRERFISSISVVF